MSKLLELQSKLATAKATDKPAIQAQINAILEARKNSIASYTDKFVQTSLFYGSKEEQTLSIAVLFDDNDNVKTKEVNATGGKKTQRVLAQDVETGKDITLPSFSELKKFSGENEEFWSHCNYGNPFKIVFATVKSGDENSITGETYSRPTFAITEITPL